MIKESSKILHAIELLSDTENRGKTLMSKLIMIHKAETIFLNEKQSPVAAIQSRSAGRLDLFSPTLFLLKSESAPSTFPTLDSKSIPILSGLKKKGKG